MYVWDWFDPLNIEHLRAYKHLEDTGFWPKDFLPEGIKLPPLWDVCIARKIVEVYLKEKLGE